MKACRTVSNAFMKSPKPHPLPKKLRDEIAAVVAQIKDAAKAFAAARDGFRKAKAAAKRAKIGARNTRKTVKATKKRLASLQDAFTQAEKKAAKWARKHSRKPKSGSQKTSRVAADRRGIRNRLPNRKSVDGSQPPRPDLLLRCRFCRRSIPVPQARRLFEFEFVSPGDCGSQRRNAGDS